MKAPMRNFEKAMELVRQERINQVAKWGAQQHQEPIWFLILVEEVGEIAKAMLHTIFGGTHAGETKIELIQAAAVAVQWIESIYVEEEE